MPARQASDMTEQTAKRLKEGKKLGGRPSKYTNQIIRNAKHYLAHYQDEGKLIPTIAGLANHLNIDQETVHRWRKEEGKEEFSNVLNKLKDFQEEGLLQGGLSGDFNPAITKLVLGKHGYHDNADKSGTSVNVTINRGSVQVETQGQVIDVETDLD